MRRPCQRSVAAAAGLKSLEILRRDGQYDTLRTTVKRLMKAAGHALDAEGIPHRIVGDPTLFEVVFTDRDVRGTYQSIVDAAPTIPLPAAGWYLLAGVGGQGLMRRRG